MVVIPEMYYACVSQVVLAYLRFAAGTTLLKNSDYTARLLIYRIRTK